MGRQATSLKSELDRLARDQVRCRWQGFFCRTRKAAGLAESRISRQLQQQLKEKHDERFKCNAFRSAAGRSSAGYQRACASVRHGRHPIESSARNLHAFRTYLKGDDIKVKSKDGAVTLTGTVAEEARKLLAGETVASLPEVKSVNNKLEVKGDRPSRDVGRMADHESEDHPPVPSECERQDQGLAPRTGS